MTTCAAPRAPASRNVRADIRAAIATCALLLLERSGFRPLELAMGSLVAVVGVCYLAELVIQPVLVMQGFAGFRISVWVRRGLTMIPSFVVIGLGIDATRALVLSQVVLSRHCRFRWRRCCGSPAAAN